MQIFSIIMLAAGAVFSVFYILIIRVAFPQRTLVTTSSNNFVVRYIEEKEKEIVRCGTNMSILQYLALQFVLPFFVASATAFLTDDLLTTVLITAIVLIIPEGIIRIQKSIGNSKFEEKYMRALVQMASSLHSGKSIVQAVDSVVACDLLDANIRNDFAGMSAKLKLGTPIAEVFETYAEETGSSDAADVATTISIMIEVGGDPGKAIERLIKDIENRLMYRKKRKTMMSEGKIVAIAADIVPAGIVAGLFIFMPNTVRQYFESPVLMVAFIGLVAILIIGSIVVHKMLDDKIDIS